MVKALIAAVLIIGLLGGAVAQNTTTAAPAGNTLMTPARGRRAADPRPNFYATHQTGGVTRTPDATSGNDKRRKG